MSASSPERMIKVRCTSWEQVEAFYRHKLRANTLVVKMPFAPTPGEGVAVALGLPNGLVLAIDGEVAKIGAAQPDGRVPVVLRMTGFSESMKHRLDELCAEGKGEPVPAVSPLPAAPEVELSGDEKPILAELEEERRKLIELPTHAVLGVAPDADAAAVRAGWVALARRWHPDLFAGRSPVIRLAAAELLIHVNRAYERLTGADGEGRVGWLVEPEPAPLPAARPARPARAAGTSPSPSTGRRRVPMSELAGAGDSPPEEPDDVPFDTARGAPLSADDLFGNVHGDARVTGSDRELTDAAALAVAGVEHTAQTLKPGAAKPATDPPRPAASGTEPPVPHARQAELQAFAEAGREALGASRFAEAREKFAAALRIDPRNRPIRALYHVASGHDLRAKGDSGAATVQFETALAHDRECEEARRALHSEQGEGKKGIIRRLFDR